MRKITTKKETKNYEIEIDGRVYNMPVRDYMDNPDISFMVMRELNIMNDKYKEIDPDYDGKTLDFEELISKAFFKSTQTKDEKKAHKIIKSVTTDVKKHVLTCLGFIVDYDISILKNVSYNDVLEIFKEIMYISQGMDDDSATITEQDKKKELLSMKETTTGSENQDTEN